MIVRGIFLFFILAGLTLTLARPVYAETAHTPSKSAKSHAAKHSKSHAKNPSKNKTQAKVKTTSQPSPIALIGSNPKHAALVIDGPTGMILEQSEADKTVHPASLTKMMTLLVTFQALQEGRITLHDQIRISAYARSMAPSKLNLPVGSTIRLDDAIEAVVTKSANDIAVAIAEHVAGTHGTFVSMMNRKAAALGMKKTYFMNACGLHNPRQVTTARDMARLAQALIYDYPLYYRYFSTPQFTYKGQTYANHNHLMEIYRGMDGIKTGYIEPSGFNLVASAKRGDRRLIGVVFGGRSAKSRDAEMQILLDRAFAQPSNVTVAGVLPAPGAKPALPTVNPVDANPSKDAAAKWSELGPMLQNKAVTSVIGQGDSESLVMASREAVTGPQGAPRPPMAAASDPAVKRDWSIQIGAYNSRAKTDEALRNARLSLPASLNRGVAMIAPLQTADGWVFRGRFIGYTKDEATQACGILLHCLAVSPDAGTN